MPIVIDASAIVGQALEDESAEYAESVICAIEVDHGHNPTIFWYELRNILVIGERRGRIAADDSARLLDAVEELSLICDPQPDAVVTLQLARQFALTVYDAAYLELALRLSASLATLDRRLRTVAADVGVRVFGIE